MSLPNVAKFSMNVIKVYLYKNLYGIMEFVRVFIVGKIRANIVVEASLKEQHCKGRRRIVMPLIP